MGEPSWAWMSAHTSQESHLISVFFIFFCLWTQAEALTRVAEGAYGHF